MYLEEGRQEAGAVVATSRTREMGKMLIGKSIGLSEVCLRLNSGRKSRSILAIVSHGRDLTECGEVLEGVRPRRSVPIHPSV